MGRRGNRGFVVAGFGAARCAAVRDAGKLLTGRLAAAGGLRQGEFAGVVRDAVPEEARQRDSSQGARSAGGDCRRGGVAAGSCREQKILDLRLCLYKRLVATEVSVAGAEKDWCRSRRRVSWLGMLLVRLWRCLESCFAAAMGELVRRCLWAAGEYVAANSSDASEEELRSL
ncbi:hypothetical protein MLD38_021093 [Melastoma candidum]|uniref:Uncharacterized protein n=1 Tax=Melastoma candidum TaxID=119954 RepID=A0ACB9QFY5_9MYRT|nr:hypothetical protein MLD38_021093 [Melastoma candidum]